MPPEHAAEGGGPGRSAILWGQCRVGGWRGWCDGARIAIFVARIVIFLVRIAIFGARIAIFGARIAIFGVRIVIFIARIAIFGARIAIFVVQIAIVGARIAMDVASIAMNVASIRSEVISAGGLPEHCRGAGTNHKHISMTIHPPLYRRVQFALLTLCGIGFVASCLVLPLAFAVTLLVSPPGTRDVEMDVGVVGGAMLCIGILTAPRLPNLALDMVFCLAKSIEISKGRISARLGCQGRSIVLNTNEMKFVESGANRGVRFRVRSERGYVFSVLLPTYFFSDQDLAVLEA